MTNGTNSTALYSTVIGGPGGIGDDLDLDVSEAADDLNVTTTEFRNVFKDISDTLEPSNSFLGKIFNSGRDLYVPSFQRKYSWEETHHEQFWSSLLEVFSRLHNSELDEGEIDLGRGNGERLEENYFGTVYIAEASKADGEDIYEVIDGQQRLATLFIILNEIRENLEEYESVLYQSDDNEDTANGVEYLRQGVVTTVLYNNIINSGKSDYLRLKLTDHDDPYFRFIFEDDITNIIEVADDLPDGSFPNWLKISNILDKLDREMDEDEHRFDDLDVDSSHDSVSDILGQSKYHASSHEKLLNAKATYRSYVDEFLDDDLGISDDDYKKRSISLINLAILLLESFRIVECEFREPVDDSLKIDVFKSLNETGKNLDIHEKIRARVVAKFGMGSAEVDNFERLVQEFGETDDKIKSYIVDYVLANEKDDIYEKGEIKDNLLQVFSTRSFETRTLDTKLVETDDHDPSNFIDDLSNNAIKYKDINNNRLKREYFESEEVHNECRNILTDLPGEQWKPFIFLMYIELSQDSAIVSGRFFRDMLKLTENLMLRNTFASAAATAIDKTFIAACVKFNNRATPEFEDIGAYDGDEEWIEEIDEFSSNTRRVMEAHLIQNSNWQELSGGQFVRSLYDQNWSNKKQILKKLARNNTFTGGERGRSGAVDPYKKIDFTSLEREHVFPKAPKLSSKENPYNWFRDFFQIDEDNPPRGEIVTVYRSLIDEDDPSEEKEDRLRRLSETFINDIGNSILLQRPLNNAISNRQFSIKILSYYLRSYNDLMDFGEFVADHESLEISIEDLVKLVECFGLELNGGEAELLLREIAQIFDTVGISDIDAYTMDYDLHDEFLLSEEGFIENFETSMDFFEEFDLERHEGHESLYDDWEEYTVGDDALEHSESGRSATIGQLIDESIESVIGKIASRNDETSETHVEACGEYGDEGSIIDKFNMTWTWEKVVERKVSLIMEIKNLVEFDTVDDEFRDHEDEFDYHRQRVEEVIKY